MESARYRSFVVRAWGAGTEGGRVSRVLVEEVQSGRRVELRGDQAQVIAHGIISALAGHDDPNGSRATPSESTNDGRPSGRGERTVILVVGATGMLGGEICRRLSAAGLPVRGLVRQTSAPDAVAALRSAGVETVEGDLRDPGSLATACEGASAVITTVTAVSSYRPGTNDLLTTDTTGTMHLIDAAADAGVGQFVYTSFSGNLELDMPLRSAKRAVEAHLRASGMGYTILRPSYFMQIWLGPAVGFQPAQAKAVIYGPGTERISWIAVGDVAAFAVRSLGDPAARDAILELGGPEALSPLEVVRIFEEVGGRTFEIEHVPVDILATQQATSSDPLAQSYAGLMRCAAMGDRIDMTATLRDFPVQLTSVRQYAEAVLLKVPVEAR